MLEPARFFFWRDVKLSRIVIYRCKFRRMDCTLQSNQVKRTSQESVNEFIIQKLNLTPVTGTTNGFIFQIINSLIESWGVRLTWFDCKLKLHSLWRTTLWLKIQTKNYFGFKHASSKVHFRSTGGQTFYWSIMTADDSIKCRCANSGMTGQVGGFQNPGVCLQAFPCFFPHPLPALLLAPFVARSVWLSFLVLCS